MPGDQPTKPAAKEVAQGPAPAIPAAAQFAPGKTNVIGGQGIAKAPLPALYHAGMKTAKAAEAAEKAGAAAKPPIETTAEAMAKPGAESAIVIPEGAEVTKDGPKVTRAKRFKNPTLGPKSTEPPKA
jgi:hypothetical protein